MEESKVDMFIMTNAKFFESHHIPMIKDALLSMDESKWTFVQSLSFKDPIISLVLSLCAGTLGVDRFFVGDVGLGIAKLLTCGGMGFWVLIDFFLIMGVAKKRNLEQLQQILVLNDFVAR